MCFVFVGSDGKGTQTFLMMKGCRAFFFNRWNVHIERAGETETDSAKLSLFQSII